MRTQTLLRTPPPDPCPVAPLHAAVVDGALFTLSWEPVAESRRNRVQIASNPTFEQILFEHDVSGKAHALAVWYANPGDDETYFWRVLAENDAGWSSGGRIESLTTGTAGQVGLFAEPDSGEPFGPVVSLFSDSALQALHPHRQLGATATTTRPGGGLERFEVSSLGLVLLVALSIIFGAALFAALTIFVL